MAGAAAADAGRAGGSVAGAAACCLRAGGDGSCEMLMNGVSIFYGLRGNQYSLRQNSR